MDVGICDYEMKRLMKQEEIKQSQTVNWLILKHNRPERDWTEWKVFTNEVNASLEYSDRNRTQLWNNSPVGKKKYIFYIFTYMSNMTQWSLACVWDRVSWGAVLKMTYRWNGKWLTLYVHATQ